MLRLISSNNIIEKSEKLAAMPDSQDPGKKYTETLKLMDQMKAENDFLRVSIYIESSKNTQR